MPDNEDSQREESQREDSQRIDNLELKLMDLENTVHELHEVIVRQYRDIERLQLQQEELLKRSSGVTASENAPLTTDELPPHY